MNLGIDPTVDYAFKHFLGRESTIPILIDVIDQVLAPPPGHEIQAIELLNPFNPKEFLDDKLSILDIKARDQSGRQFNIEMQMLFHRSLEQRILFYWSKLYQQQLHEGERYWTLRPTITICFLNDLLFPQLPDYHLTFRLLEQKHLVPFVNDVAIHILELPKFKKPETELANGLDRWLYFLRHAATIDVDEVPAQLRQPLILRAMEELKMLSQTDVERERYEARRIWQLDYNTSMRDARQMGAEDGRAL